MSSRSARGPFRPGTGATPPYLAGREEEQELFGALLADLSNGIPPGAPVILYGPRGNGKTVLLAWLEAEVASRPGVEAERRTPSDIPDRARLAEELLPDSWWERYAPAEVAVAGVRWRPGQGRPPSARAVLSARAERRPFVLLVDEAHTLGIEAGRALLNAAQEVGSKAPFLLVLAGTPNLEGTLNAMGASFWNRAEQIRVGRLGDEATADALGRPFADEGIAVDAGALAMMVRESQGYPFFIQLLGRAVWRCVTSRRRVTRTVVDAARSAFDAERDEYYRHRLDELKKFRLLRVGRSVAGAFEESAVLTDPQLDSAVVDGLGDGTPEELDRATAMLRDLGYIWRARTRPEWEAGIPSLLDYVRRHAPGT